MIKFNLLRPDDDFPEDVLEREEAEVEEEIEDPPLEEEEGSDEESEETLDETVLDELDEYKNIPGEEKVIPLEEDKTKKNRKKGKSKKIILFELNYSQFCCCFVIWFLGHVLSWYAPSRHNKKY